MDRTMRNGTAATRIGMLGAIGVALFAGSADAAVVTFDNTDGTFNWKYSVRYADFTSKYGSFLDITQPPTQSGDRNPGTFGKWYYFNNSSSNPALSRVVGEEVAEVA